MHWFRRPRSGEPGWIEYRTVYRDGNRLTPASGGCCYERNGDQRSGRISRVRKPVIAQIEGVAVGGGFGIAAGADIRIATRESRFGLPIARTLGNCLSMKNCAAFADLIGPFSAALRPGSSPGSAISCRILSETRPAQAS